MIHAELSIQAIWYLGYKKKREYKIIFYIICRHVIINYVLYHILFLLYKNM